MKAAQPGSGVKTPDILNAYRCVVGDVVIIRTRAAIGGQNEHAAMVTKVAGDASINVMLMPAEGVPFPIAGIFGAWDERAANVTWGPRG